MSIITDLFANGAANLLQGASKIVGEVVKDPNQMAQINEQLQSLVTTHQEAMAKIADDQLSKQLADVASARNMEVKLNEATSAGWMAKNIAPMLAIGITLVWGSLTIYLLMNMLNLIAKDPSVNMTAVLGVYSALTGMEGIILNFEFGSSKSSQSKDETISKIAQQP